MHTAKINFDPVFSGAALEGDSRRTMAKDERILFFLGCKIFPCKTWHGLHGMGLGGNNKEWSVRPITA